MGEEGVRKQLQLRVGDERIQVGESRPLVVLGRNPTSDIVFEDEYVSRFHARLEYRNGSYYLRDESQNGTYIIWSGQGSVTHVHCKEVELVGSGRLSLGRRFEMNKPENIIEFVISGMSEFSIENEPVSVTVGKITKDDAMGTSTPTVVFFKGSDVSGRQNLLDVYLAYRLFEEYTDRIIVLLSKEGFIKYYNSYLERLTRRKYADFVGQDFFSFVHPEDRQNLIDILTQISLGTSENFHVSLRLCTTEPRWQSYTFLVGNTTPSLQALDLDGVVLLSLAEESVRFRGELLAGRYRIVQNLRTSNFCETYLGEDTHRPSVPRCIIKKLQLKCSNEPGAIQTARRLFYQEALTLENLGYHDRIPFLLAYFEDNDYFYLVQDFIEGQSLDTLLTTPWSELSTVNLLRQVLLILRYVHSQDVIHRDVKPANIIRRKFDDNYVLIDFGSVKLLPNEVWSKATGNKNHPLTVVVGTPGYMAPEQALGRPTKASDIYSLGVIAIEALLGQSYQNLRHNWISELESRNIDTELIRILKRMVATDVSERYQDVSEILLELSYLSLMQVSLHEEI